MQYSPVCKCPSVCARAHGPFIKRTFSSWLVFFIDIRKSLVYQRLDIQTTWRYTCLFVLCVCVCALWPRIRFTRHAPAGSRANPFVVKVEKQKQKNKYIWWKKERRERNDNFSSILFWVSCCLLSLDDVGRPFTHIPTGRLYIIHRHNIGRSSGAVVKIKEEKSRRRQRGNEKEWGKLM